VRRRQDVLAIQLRLGGEVGAVLQDLTRLQGRHHRRVVDDGTARVVDEAYAVFHLSDLLFADIITGLVV